MRVIFKRYLSYEEKEMEYYLEHMAKRGYRLVKIFDDFLCFSKEKEKLKYCVVNSEREDIKELKDSFAEKGWGQIGKNKVFTIFGGANVSDQIVAGKTHSSWDVKMNLYAEFWAMLVTALTLAIVIGMKTTRGTEMSVTTAGLYMLANFVSGITIFYMLTEVYNMVRVSPNFGGRVQSVRVLYAVGNIAMLCSMLYLLVLGIYAVVNEPWLLSARIIILWILWPLLFIYSKSTKQSFIRATAEVAEITYIIVLLEFGM